MGGDYSRMTFKPARDYNGVFKQQGRVGLEADHNELVEIIDRRWRAESIDIMGCCAVPISNSENRTAFEILPEPVSAASFTIGRGRMYVDGLQIECRGDGQVEYDASLGEERGKDPLPYDKQPHFYPNNPLLPDPPCAQNTGLTDLVYVDAWEREVTAIEDPDIREIALGGPDTATRLQTVWQVRVLSNVGLHTCGDDILAWNALTLPTTGRLTTAAVAPPASDDPCVLSPTGGYRGLENRLYRVEIHDSGELRAPDNAVASFKWSRDNGSILTRVEDIPAPNQLKVQRIGRDSILRFKVGDWVEVSDDPTEFALKAGHLAQVTNVDEANRMLTIDTPIPISFGFNATKTEWHTRVRRWDGVGDVVTGAIDLEDGVQITFGPALGDTFKNGDYWVLAARTADGSVEKLVNAAPRGVQHHYCRLALIIWNNPLVRLDCREFWPAEGCCTEIVWPGEDIQAAIDRLPAAGGCVCLKPGLHEIFKPLTIARPNVTFHGETIGAVIRSDLSTRMLSIAGTKPGLVNNVMVHDIRFETLAPSSDAIILTHSVGNAVVRECEIFVDLRTNPRAMAVGIVVSGVGATATITMNEIAGVVIGVIAIAAQRAEITHNQIEGALLPFRGTTAPIGQYGVLGATAADGFVVEENTLSNFWIGIYIARSSQRSIIVRNRIARSGTASMAPQTLLFGGLIPLGPTNTLTFFAIDCASPESTIAENSMNTVNEVQGGVRVTAAAVRVEGNRIISELPQGWVQPPPVGVFLQTPDDNSNVSECVVVANRIFGPQTGIDVAATRPAAANNLQILDNVYRGIRIGPGVFAYGILVMNAHNSLVAGNAIETCAFGIALGGTTSVAGNRVRGNRVSSVAIGIFSSLQQTLAVSDNFIDTASLVGIVGGGCVSATYSENRIAATTTGIISTSGATTAINANSIVDGASGIIVYKDIDIVVDGNTIENMEFSGIATLQIVGSTVRDNRVAWCGYGTGAGGPLLTAAIAQVSTAVSATIESCEVADTGRSRDGKQATVQDTYSVLQIGVTDAHVRTNRINNAAGLSAKNQHAGIFVAFGSQAEITDNIVTGNDARPLISVPGINFIFFNFRFSDIICSGNRCVHSVPVGGPNLFAGTASVVLAADRVASVGNHVRATNPNFPSFDTSNTGFVTATGNITSGDWIPAGGPTFVPALLTANHIRI
jgi:nitrous oxidase accessory protein NosD